MDPLEARNPGSQPHIGTHWSYEVSACSASSSDETIVKSLSTRHLGSCPMHRSGTEVWMILSIPMIRFPRTAHFSHFGASRTNKSRSRLHASEVSGGTSAMRPNLSNAKKIDRKHGWRWFCVQGWDSRSVHCLALPGVIHTSEACQPPIESTPATSPSLSLCASALFPMYVKLHRQEGLFPLLPGGLTYLCAPVFLQVGLRARYPQRTLCHPAWRDI